MRSLVSYLSSFLFLLGAGCTPDKPSSATSYSENNAYFCSVHDRTLNYGFVPILYGYIPPNADRNEARMSLFPNANSYIPGGCSPLAPNYDTVWCCSRCRQDEEVWKRKHEEDKTPYSNCATVAQLEEAALRQTNGGWISVAMIQLQERVSTSTSVQEVQECEDALAAIASKLENGWVGYVGAPRRWEGKQLIRETPKELLARNYRFMRFLATSLRSKPCTELLIRIRPQPEHPDLLGLWQAIQDVKDPSVIY